MFLLNRTDNSHTLHYNLTLLTTNGWIFSSKPGHEKTMFSHSPHVNQIKTDNSQTTLGMKRQYSKCRLECFHQLHHYTNFRWSKSEVENNSNIGVSGTRTQSKLYTFFNRLDASATSDAGATTHSTTLHAMQHQSTEFPFTTRRAAIIIPSICLVTRRQTCLPICILHPFLFLSRRSRQLDQY